MKKSLVALGVLSFLVSSSFAGGFDANSLWSARYTGVGGAAVSNVQGAQSLYFNPAGLSQSKTVELDLNFNSGFVRKKSPVKPQDDGPLNEGASPQMTPIMYAPIMGFFGAHQINSRLGVGAGVYVAGGSGGTYEDVDFRTTFPTLRPDVESTVFLFELGLGLGYQVTDSLSVGFAWRPSYLSLNNKAAAPLDLNADGAADVLLVPELKDLSVLILGGFRFGIQFHPPKSNWGLGLSYRSENEFTAKGKSTGESQLAGDSTVSSISGGDVKAKSKLPMMLSLGGHYDPKSNWRIMSQYDYIRNERVKSLKLSGQPLGINGIGEFPISSFTSTLGWRNQNSFRFGTEFQLNEKWMVRAGHIHSTPVASENRASPFGNPPGSERSYIIGGGRPVKLFKRPVHLDLALEYINSKGHGNDSKPGSLDGRYDAHAVGFFSALSYRI